MPKDSRMTKVRREKARRRRGRIITYVLTLLWTLMGLVGLIAVIQWTVGKAAGREDRAYGYGITKEGTQALQGEPTADDAKKGDGKAENNVWSEEERSKCRELYSNDQELLVLVNKEHELSEDYDPMLRTICNGRLQASERLYDDLCAMLEAANDAGYDYWIASAYRSRQRQQELVDEDVSAGMQEGASYEDALAEVLRETMPAGHSEHETGLSLDILCSTNTNMDASQAGEAGNQWLVSHCAEYGFILRYPEDKVNVTGIDYEPWHFRYVGREAAQFLTERGMTLEEFWEAAGQV